MPRPVGRVSTAWLLFDAQDTVRRLKLDLEEERSRNNRLADHRPGSGASPTSPEEADWETKKAVDEYKFKLQKADQDIVTLQTNASSCRNIVSV